MTVEIVLRVLGVSKLASEAPENAHKEKVVAHAHEITLDVELDAEGGLGVVLGDAADVGGETLLGVERAFVDAARVGVGDKVAVPPVTAKVKKQVVDNAVAKGGGDDLADDGVADDKSHAAAGMVSAVDDMVAQETEIFDIAKFKTVFIDGVTFAATGVLVGDP